jgi:uncharacterized membrane protein YhaH (DUF805 family)
MSIYLQPFKKYSDFSGRASRLEYWSFYLFHTLASLALVVVGMLGVGIAGLLGKGLATAVGVLVGLAFVVFAIGSIVPFIAVGVRRMHDQNLSGWFLLISFIPFVGGLAVIVMLCLPGTVGDNKYGVDPKSIGE